MGRFTRPRRDGLTAAINPSATINTIASIWARRGIPTLYGTETGLRTVINAAHSAGLNYGIDMVWNHSGFSDENTSSGSFLAAGGYPGFVLQLNSSNNSKGYVDQYGDYHNYSDAGNEAERLAGLIDVDQSKNYQFIRQPTTAGPNNIPAGTISWNGRTGQCSKRQQWRFYPDTSLQPISVYNPATGQMNIKIYPFNNANPMAGDPVQENALGYLMRNTQWMVQSLGVDFFRIDAAKNMPSWVLNYYDQAVYRQSTHINLDGTQENVWGFSEYYDGTSANIANAGVVKYSINPERSRHDRWQSRRARLPAFLRPPSQPQQQRPAKQLEQRRQRQPRHERRRQAQRQPGSDVCIQPRRFRPGPLERCICVHADPAWQCTGLLQPAAVRHEPELSQAGSRRCAGRAVRQRDHDSGRYSRSIWPRKLSAAPS